MSNHNKGKLDQLVQTATDLFMRFGIKRVSIEEICRTANVSKMTFYKHFSNKMDLVKYILTHISDQQMIEYKSIMKQKIPFAEKVKLMIDMKQRYTGKISAEFMQDLLMDSNTEVREFFENQTKDVFQIVTNDFVAAQKSGEVRSDINPNFILFMLNHIIEMYSDERLVKLYDSPQDLNMELLNFFFYGLLTSDN